MALSTNVISLWNQQLVEATSYTFEAGVPLDLLVSQALANSVYNSLKISIKYENLLPAEVTGSFYIGAEVDFKDANGNWRMMPIYQGNPLRRSDQAPERILIMQPNLILLNMGETESIFRGPVPVCEVSRVQGSLPEGDTRVRIVIVEMDPAGVNKFQSVKITAEAEQYSL